MGSRARVPIRDTILDMCRYGTPYPKRKRLRSVNVDLEPAARRCSGQGTFSRTWEPHLHLQEKSNGAFLTLRAEAYPRTLCRSLVQCLANAPAAKLASALGAVLQRA